MTDLRTAAQQALEALECGDTVFYPQTKAAIAALKAALAEPVQEPVAWKDKTYESLHHQDFGNSIPLYTAPPQRKPLPDEDAAALIELDPRMLTEFGTAPSGAAMELIRRTERAHGIGGQE